MIFPGHLSSYPPAIVKFSKSNLKLCWLLIILMSFSFFFTLFSISSSISIFLSLPATLSLFFSLPHPLFYSSLIPYLLSPSLTEERIINTWYELYLQNPPRGLKTINKCYFLVYANKLCIVGIDYLFSKRIIDLSWNKLQ